MSENLIQKNIVDVICERIIKNNPYGLILRTDLKTKTGGILNGSYHKNLDRKGIGIKNSFIIGNTVAYPINDVIAFIKKKIIFPDKKIGFQVIAPNLMYKLTHKNINLMSPNIKISLHTDMPKVIGDDMVWGDLTNEISVIGTNYTAGGILLTGKKCEYQESQDNCMIFNAHDAVWPNLNATFKHAVIYQDETVNGLVKPIIAILTMKVVNDIAQNCCIEDNDYTIAWSPAGIFHFQM